MKGECMRDDVSMNGKAMKRDEWEIRDDLHAIERSMEVFKDKERLGEVQDMIRKDKEKQVNLDAIESGDIAQALGL